MDNHWRDLLDTTCLGDDMVDDTTDPFERCPFCDAQPLPMDEQPVSGLHAYTEIYTCGTTVDHVIGCADIKPIVRVCCKLCQK